MGRWTRYEEESERLPSGMKRVGYDADTQRYTFQDENGVLYESEPGTAYGALRLVVRDYERDIRQTRPNAFESSKKTSSTGIAHSHSTSTPGSNLRSFQDFLPSTAITSPPRRSSPSSQPSDSLIPDVISKVRSMTSVVSRLQTSNRPSEAGVRYQHLKSPSLPVLPLSGFRKPESSPARMPPPVPPKSRGYSQISRKEEEEEEEEDEMKEKLLRSKTPVTRPSASPSALGSKRSSMIHHFPFISSPSRPSQRASQASRMSSISTTSTITPMKAR